MPGSKRLERVSLMLSEMAMKLENLSKCFYIYEKPRDRLMQMLSFGKKQYYREFWALNDISFEIKRGQTVGIIGRNGSGKSTLLQILCGTLNQTSGSVKSDGRIAALLELGSGFNPEFTGRENIYMNASVLGLSAKQINDRFDSIADFADIGDFIDQPVKTYSSGMYVRLAFSVIAHVDADILVIDEALAVGDAVFTQKCMRFLRQFKERGTLIFVSHDMGSVLNLCEQVIWLTNGHITKIGKAKDIVESYLQYTQQEIHGQDVTLTSLESSNPKARNTERLDQQESDVIPVYRSQMKSRTNLNDSNGWKSGHGEILSVKLEHIDGNIPDLFQGGEQVKMLIKAAAYKDLEKPIFGFLFRDRLGQDLFGENTLQFSSLNPKPMPAGRVFQAEFVFTLPMLPNGQYTVMTSLADGDLQNNVQHHWLHEALIITVSSSKVRWGLVGVNFYHVELRQVDGVVS